MAAREFPARDLRVAAPYRMRHPLGEDSPQMLLVERDHEIHTLAANCANHAFAIGICLWSADRRCENAEVHRLQRSIYGAGVDSVAVVNHETVRVVAGHARPELLRSPLVRRVLGYVPVHEPAVLMSSTTKTSPSRNRAVTVTKKSHASSSQA